MNFFKRQYFKVLLVVFFILLLGLQSNAFAITRDSNCSDGSTNCVVTTVHQSGWSTFTGKIGNLFKFLFGNEVDENPKDTKSKTDVITPKVSNQALPSKQATLTPPSETQLKKSAQPTTPTKNTVEVKSPDSKEVFSAVYNSTSRDTSTSTINISSFVTTSFFERQVDRIFESISDSVQNLADSLKEKITTKLLAVSGDASIGGNLTVAGDIIGNAKTVSNGVYTNISNSFNAINPLTTLSESWIGPSATNGIYFKDGNIGLGTITPTEKLNVIGNGLFLGILTASSLNVTDKETTRANLGLTLASNDEVKSTVTPASFVTTWGDSLTAGAGGTPYPTTLSSLLNRTVYNKGVGGQTSTQIAVRQGGIQTTASISGGTIPASGGVIITFPLGNEPVTNQGPSEGVSGTISGVYGTVTYSGGTYTFTRAISGDAVSVASAPFIVDTGKLNNGIVVIWVGRNNVSNPNQIKSDIAATVSNLGLNTKYIILSITNASNEPYGSPSYTTITSLNSYLASTYTGHYIDTRSYLINHGLTDANITATPQDITDISNDVIPSSLRYDSVHLLTSGYTIIAQQITKFIQENFESEDTNSKVLVASNLQSILGSPMAIGITKPNTGIFSNLKSTSSIYLPSTSKAPNGDTIGVIYMASNPFIHTFNYGNNGTVTTAGQNTFIGIDSGNFTMGNVATSANNASYNTGVGNSTLKNNITGSLNTALGVYALLSNTTGSNNSAVGSYSLISNTTGLNNSAVGSYSLRYNTTGNSNSAFGYSSLSANTTGSDNVAFGIYSLLANTTGSGNSAVGTNSLFSNTTGTNNSAVGKYSLLNNTSGNNNSALGYNSLNANTTGGNNSSFGYYSLKANTTGGDNSSFGYYSLQANTTGNQNTSGGANSLSSNTTGNYNSALGNYALSFNVSGTNNSALGWASLYSNTTGTNNSAFGRNAGRYIFDGATGLTTGANNLFLGAETKALADGSSNEIVIGYNTVGNGSNTITLGNTSITKSYLRGTINFSSYGAGTLTTDASGNITASSDERLKDILGNYDNGGTALSKILNINPILYKWNEFSGYDRESTYAGFSAQNIESVIPEAVGTDPRGYLTLSDRPILATVVNAIKEMNLKVENLSSLDANSPSSFGSLITKFLSEQVARIHDLVVDKLNINGDVCVDDVCVTKDQFKQILINAGGTSNNQAPTQPVSTEVTQNKEGSVDTPQTENTGTTDSAQATEPKTSDSGTPATTEPIAESTSNTTIPEESASTPSVSPTDEPTTTLEPTGAN